MQLYFNGDNYSYVHICTNKQLFVSKTIFESRYIKLIFQLSLIKKKVTVIADIGDNMRAIRKHLGVTQERLAELSGLSVNFISRLERTNDQNVSLKSLRRIANALQIPITQLLENTNFNNNEPSETQNNYYKVDQLCFELKSKDPKIAIELTDSFLNILKYTK